MKRVKTVAGRGGKLVRSYPLIVLAVLMLIWGASTLAISTDANRKAAEASRQVAEEANQRTMVIEDLYERQRVTFCGFFEPISAAGKTQKPASPLGESIVGGSDTAISPKGLTCTPDPFDGR